MQLTCAAVLAAVAQELLILREFVQHLQENRTGASSQEIDNYTASWVVDDVTKLPEELRVCCVCLCVPPLPPQPAAAPVASMPRARYSSWKESVSSKSYSGVSSVSAEQLGELQTREKAVTYGIRNWCTAFSSTLESQV